MSQNKYRTFAREKKLEEEIAELTAPPVEEETEPQTTEEKTFKKRYGDLRSHLQKKEDEFARERDALRRQLQEVTSVQNKLPKTEEEIQDWMNKFPDVAKIVESIAIKASGKTKDELDERIKLVEDREKKAVEQQAYREFISLHPDFEEIRETQDWADWLSDQPQYIYDALYTNSTDVKAASRAVDLYKADRKVKKNEKVVTRDDDHASAQSIRSVGSAPSVSGGALKWTESKVKALNSRDYEKYSDEIDEASRNPAFYDISGAAR
jgi:hypothetical protein